MSLLLCFIFVLLKCVFSNIGSDFKPEIENGKILDNTTAVAYGITAHIPNSKIYIIGGCLTENQCSNTIKIYNIHTKTFNIKPITPSINEIYSISQSFTMINNLIYFVFKNKIGTFNINNDIFIYPYNNIQLQTSNMQPCLTYNKQNNNIYIIGGNNNGNPSNIMQIYSISTSNWLTNNININIARYYHSCEIYNNTIFTLFGAILSNAYGTRTYEYYNILTDNNFTLIDSNNIHVERSRHRSIIINDNIYIFGGIRGSKVPLNIISQLNPITKQFNNQIISLNKVRSGLNIEYDGYRIYVFGGFSNNNNLLEYVWEYSDYINTPPSTLPTVSTTEKPKGFDPVNNTRDLIILIIIIIILLLIIICLSFIYGYLKCKQKMVNKFEFDDKNMQTGISNDDEKEIYDDITIGNPENKVTADNIVLENDIEGNNDETIVIDGDNNINNESSDEIVGKTENSKSKSQESLYDGDNDTTKGNTNGNTVGGNSVVNQQTIGNTVGGVDNEIPDIPGDQINDNVNNNVVSSNGDDVEDLYNAVGSMETDGATMGDDV